MTPFRRIAAIATLGLATLAPSVAFAQEPYLGEIRCFGFNYQPRGWALANGQLLSIAQNSALFALLGTQFGGDGRTTFGLPNLQGRSMVHQGFGPGLTPMTMGETGGAETVTLSTANLPPHTHQVAPLGSNNDATSVSPAGKVPAAKARTTLYTDPTNLVAQAATTTSAAGGGAPAAIRSPYQVVNCAIALQGIFPPRD